MEAVAINFTPIGGVNVEVVGRYLSTWLLEVVRIVVEYTRVSVIPLWMSYWEDPRRRGQGCSSCSAHEGWFAMRLSNRAMSSLSVFDQGYCLDCVNIFSRYDGRRSLCIRLHDILVSRPEMMVIQMVHVMEQDQPVAISKSIPGVAKVGPVCWAYARYSDDGSDIDVLEIYLCTDTSIHGTDVILPLKQIKYDGWAAGYNECSLCDKKLEKRLIKYITWKTRKIVRDRMAQG